MKYFPKSQTNPFAIYNKFLQWWRNYLVCFKQHFLKTSTVEVLIIVEHVEVEPWLIYICLIGRLKAPPNLFQHCQYLYCSFFPRDISATSAIAAAIDTPSAGPCGLTCLTSLKDSHFDPSNRWYVSTVALAVGIFLINVGVHDDRQSNEDVPKIYIFVGSFKRGRRSSVGYIIKVHHYWLWPAGHVQQVLLAFNCLCATNRTSGAFGPHLGNQAEVVVVLWLFLT